MKRMILIAVVLSLFLSLSHGKGEAVFGIPDQVRAATLVVPLMEQGISTVHNTLTVVRNLCGSALTIHWELWDIDGNLVDLYGNVTLSSGETWVSDMGSIIAGASSGQLSQLTDGGYYRGFMTVDVVTSATNSWPTDPGYPFSSANCLTGFVYYVRLLEGAANGIPMIHIEGGLSSSLSVYVRGFYQSGDDREEIDNHALYYAKRTTNNQSPTADPDDELDSVISRVYLSGNGESRIVLWAWGPADWGANVAPSNAGGPFFYGHWDEYGNPVSTGFLNLPHVVNVIDVSSVTSATNTNGIFWISSIPGNFNVYAFSFNAANYTADPSLTWEAMFESTIIGEW